MTEAGLAVTLFFHILSTVVWIGGILLIVLLVVPEFNRLLAEQPALQQLLQRIRRRFAQVGNLALAVLVVTGLLMMSADANYDGLLQFDNDWSRLLLIKHVLIAGMAGLGLLLQFGVAPALERASLLLERGKGDEADWGRLRRREARLTWLIAALAVMILAASVWLSSL